MIGLSINIPKLLPTVVIFFTILILYNYIITFINLSFPEFAFIPQLKHMGFLAHKVKHGPKTALELAIKLILTARNLRDHLYKMEKEHIITRAGKKKGKRGAQLWKLMN